MASKSHYNLQFSKSSLIPLRSSSLSISIHLLRSVRHTQHSSVLKSEMYCQSFLHFCVLWFLQQRVYTSPNQVDELRNLLKEMEESTKKTLERLESVKSKGQFSAKVPAIQNGESKFSPTSFYTHLSTLNEIHKRTLKTANFSFGARLNSQVSRDIHLGMRIGEKMKTFINQSVKTNAVGLEQKIKKVACKSSKTSRFPTSRSLQHTYWKLYHLLCKISKSLLEKRFSHTA